MNLKTLLTSALVLTAAVSASAQAGEEPGKTREQAQAERMDLQTNLHSDANRNSPVPKPAGKTREQVQAELKEFQKNDHPNVLTDRYTSPL